MGSSLLVTHEDMFKPWVFLVGIGIESVVDWHDGTTGISEDRLHIFLVEGAHQDLSTADLFPDFHTGPRGNGLRANGPTPTGPTL